MQTIFTRRACKYSERECETMPAVGMASNHEGFHLKEELKVLLQKEGYVV